MFYTVQSGDTLYGISRKNNISSTELLRLNGLGNGAVLSIGQQLKVKEPNYVPTPTPKQKTGTTTNTPRNVSNATTAQYYTVRSGDSLYRIAQKHGISVDMLRKLNSFSPQATIYLGQKLQVSQGNPNTARRVSTTSANSKPQVYTVQRGDGIMSIAQKFGMGALDLMKLNYLDENDTIYVGMRLRVKGKIPTKPSNTVSSRSNNTTSSNTSSTPKRTTTNSPKNYNKPTENYKIQRGENLLTIAQKFDVAAILLVQINNLSASTPIYVGMTIKIPLQNKPSPKVANGTLTYVVQSGDWLGKIADKFRVSTSDLAKENGLRNGMISVGQTLIIPVTAKPSIPLNLEKQISKIKQMRKYFQLQQENGVGIFGNGLRGDVGRTYKNFPDDVDKVQKRLIQLKMLSASHGESPNMIGHLMINGFLNATSIPKTVAGIERFQRTFRVDYWTKKDKHIKMMGTSSFTKGLIKKNDITYKVLREYTKYRLIVPNPYKRGEKIISDFTNFARSSYNQFYDGVSFVGNSNPPIPYEIFANLGLSRNLALAVQYVSKHEGNFDSINSYDKAIFSYGFIQFAGAGGGFAPLIASMKQEEPQLFQQLFQQFGIDVSYVVKSGKIRNATLKVLDVNAQNGNYIVSGEDAERAIRADKLLYAPFMMAAYHPKMLIVQISNAVNNYVNPALSIKCSIKTRWTSLENIKLTEVINSPMGLGMMIDTTVNRWINATRDIFVAAIQRVANAQSLNTADQLRNIDERLVLQDIIRNAPDKRVTTRGTDILNSTMSSQKGSI